MAVNFEQTCRAVKQVVVCKLYHVRQCTLDFNILFINMLLYTIYIGNFKQTILATHQD